MVSMGRRIVDWLVLKKNFAYLSDLAIPKPVQDCTKEMIVSCQYMRLTHPVKEEEFRYGGWDDPMSRKSLLGYTLEARPLRLMLSRTGENYGWRPFMEIGLDFAGPFYIKTGEIAYKEVPEDDSLLHPQMPEC